ncbi:MAG: sigma 54-interacting transcriptional regulator [Castellaniella sp.]|uniref:sigma 54-interacting transcriptional regulator n=2 Tax=Castellaniella sp. TaxID=1955812 RepID=UPI002AFF603A|nr:sigma 54-interacting transcriptional regulator [Castellaniella sp.]
MTPLSMPSNRDIRRLVRFSTEDGLIWLGEQRMVLLHLASLQAIRHEMIAFVGPLHARRLLMRAGYAAGSRDAALARRVRPDASLLDAFSVGPQLHMLEGAVRVSLLRFDVDLSKGHLLCRVRWDDSWEAHAHAREETGPAEQPVCWMLLGYASGYTSQFFGRRALFREIRCAACGAPHCEIEGRFLDEWPDAGQLLRDYEEDSMLERLEQLHSQVEAFRNENPVSDDQGLLIGQSPAFQETVTLLRHAAPTSVSVLLTGETGVGKERFARALHAMSPRADKPFVAINCAALPAELIESELFGSEKGAYTGASSARLGRFERANGGTLLLDELGDLPLQAQAKLLRFLQSGEIERLGGHETRRVDVRVIAATNVDLELAVAEGRFRADLLYRLNVYPIRIPALRERPEDIEPLARHLLQRVMLRHGKRVVGLSDRALVALRTYGWPGNVRELENLIERGLILTPPGRQIDASVLFPNAGDDGASTMAKVDASGQLDIRPEAPPDLTALILDAMRSKGLSLEALEDSLLHEAVARARGSVSAAARSIGLTRAQLSYRLTQRAQKAQK